LRHPNPKFNLGSAQINTDFLPPGNHRKCGECGKQRCRAHRRTPNEPSWGGGEGGVTSRKELGQGDCPAIPVLPLTAVTSQPKSSGGGSIFWPVSVCNRFVRFRFGVVIGLNECRQAGEAGVCRPFLPQIKSSQPKSTVDLGGRRLIWV